MLTWIIQIFIISIIFIFLVHHLLMFFKTTLTIPRVKDLVNTPNEKYQNIYDTILHKTSSSDYTDIDLLPNNNFGNESNVMKDELKSFLKKQLNGNISSNNNVVGLDSISGNFSNF